jgi:hypothetical protein
MGTSSKALADGLAEIVAAQQGFFTAKQAVDAGYADSVHAYHVRNGDWVKVHRGIYRLADHEEPARPELITWSLWSRGRDDRPQGVYSGQTALEIHGVAERVQGPLEMTVPTSFRRNSELPAEVKLFKEDLADSDVEARDGYLVTTLDKAVRDASDRGTKPKLTGQPAKAHGAEAPKQGHFLSTKPKISGTQREDGFRSIRVTWDERWDGAVQEASWNGGKSFEDALNSGED